MKREHTLVLRALISSALVLQLRIGVSTHPTPVMSEGGVGLMASSPDRPGHNERSVEGRFHHEPCKKNADFGDARCGEEGQAAIGSAGLVSFGLSQTAFRSSAASLVRKASAAMHSVT